MKFIPILFSTHMVQATLEDRKTMTRRLKGLDMVNQQPDKVEFVRFQTYPDGSLRAIFQHVDDDKPGAVKCPYGKPGDVLWVRESFIDLVDDAIDTGRFVYKTSVPPSSIVELVWKLSIHMPKLACRIFLAITNIRVERLHDINEADAIAEGVECELGVFPTFYKNYNQLTRLHEFEYCEATDSFESLWQNINGAESWNANPWVWVISFKKIERPAGFLTGV